ncbi:MAG: DNA polymerase-3 subunit epsilon [Crocinitomicaceae bacterium]|jgi:DNA polymerase-3 subunit epsilon
MTAKVWMAILENIGDRYNAFDLSFEQIQKLAKTPKKSVDKLLKSWSQ